MALKKLTVTTSGDTDNDGLPDDYELANGLNPNDPIDAFEDQDGDGLSALGEFNAGTNLNIADTDGDGIQDGEELIAGADGFITSAINFDTDSDGLSDGLEVQLGSDPTSAASANYAAALIDIRVTPGDAVIYYNTIDGESSIQLSVTGTLIDGNEIDLTAASRGTTYTSSDLSIVSFGIDAGRVYAGQEGLATVTVASNGFTVDSNIHVITFSPTVRSFLELPGAAENVKASGGYAYIPAGNAGLWIVDYQDSSSPYLAATLSLGGNSQDVRIDPNGNYAYVANQTGLVIVDISDPLQPVVASSVATLGNAQDLSVSGNVVTIADGNNGLVIIDISNRLAPTLISTVAVADLGAGAIAVAVENDNVTVGTANGLVTVNMVNTSLPTVQGLLALTGVRDLVVRDGYVHVAAYSQSQYRVVDITTPATPVDVGGVAAFYPFDVALAGDRAFFADILFTSAIPHVNIQTPESPAYQGVVDMSSFGDWDCRGIDANFYFAFCTANKSSQGRLYIVQYRNLVDVAGIAPTTAITQPAAGSMLQQGRPYKLVASASDDVAVAAVSFIVNDEVVHTDLSAPYEYVHRVPVDVTGITFATKAVDLAGNEGFSTPISYAVEAPVAVDEAWQDETVDYFNYDLIAASVVMQATNYLSSYSLTSIGDFTVQGTGNSTLNVAELNVDGDLVIDGVMLTVDTTLGINVLGDVRLINGGKLTVSNATVSPAKVNTLALNITGHLIVDAGAMIDLNGKGYPANLYSGPDFSYNTRYSCYGGLRSNTSSDCSYGRIDHARFPGSAGYVYSSSTAKGGGVAIITAASVQLNGVIRANGIAGHYNYGGGAGGGIHIETGRLFGTGAMEVRGASSTTHTAGGGRISIITPDASGYSDIFRTGSVTSKNPAGAGTAFIKDPAQKYGHLRVDNAGKVAPTRSTRLRQVGRHTITAVQALGGDQWQVSVAGTPWKATDTVYDWGLQGIEVDLDVSEDAGAHYLILSNTTNTFVIETGHDLSSIVGNELVGVHTFQKLTLTTGAWLDVGDDRLVVLEVGNSTIDSTSTISGSYLPSGIAELVLTTGGTLTSDQTLHIPALTLTSGSGSIIANALVVDGDLNIDGATLKLGVDTPIKVGGNISLENGAVLTVPTATKNPRRIYHLDLDVSGTVSIAAGTRIDLNSKGYPYIYNPYGGPDFTQNKNLGCHGGIYSGGTTDCTYGRFEKARFAGSGHYWYANGGGVASIKAWSLVLNGLIRANGDKGSSSYSGAGGGIHIDVTMLSGVGSIQAMGANNSTGGAGGRISIYSTDRTDFSGSVIARAGNTWGTSTSGAGTVYYKDAAQAYGHLVVDNNGIVAKTGSTPMRHVGKQVITAVSQPSPGTWLVTVSGAPWKATSTAYDWGVDGIEVDLDASELLSTHYRIVSNTTNRLTIETTDDLTAVVGNELIGVQTFETVTITGGAQLNFVGDRVIVQDTINSVIDSTASLTASLDSTLPQ